MGELNRRGFVTAAGVSGLGLLLSTPTAGAVDRALRESVQRAVTTGGTTLETAAAAVTPGTAYTRLTGGPGWPPVVRQDLAAGKDGRDDRRRPMTSFVQFTDLHITDAESPRGSNTCTRSPVPRTVHTRHSARWPRPRSCGASTPCRAGRSPAAPSTS